MNANVIGVSAVHRNPSKLYDQRIPKCSYRGYVSSGRSTAVTIIRKRTDDAKVEAE